MPVSDDGWMYHWTVNNLPNGQLQVSVQRGDYPRTKGPRLAHGMEDTEKQAYDAGEVSKSELDSQLSWVCFAYRKEGRVLGRIFRRRGTKGLDNDFDLLEMVVLPPETGKVTAAKCLERLVRVNRHLGTPFPGQATTSLKPGDIVTHVDETKTHRAIVLEAGVKECTMLMVTRNPYWSPSTRRVTQDEAALLGMPHRDTSYLAPVVRPTYDVAPSGLTFPEHRLSGLIEEFRGRPTR